MDFQAHHGRDPAPVSDLPSPLQTALDSVTPGWGPSPDPIGTPRRTRDGPDILLERILKLFDRHPVYSCA